MLTTSARGGIALWSVFGVMSLGGAEGSILPDKTVNKNITLRGAVILHPPFATYDDEGGFFGGFEVDLLRRLQIFAKEDGYDLNVELELAPSQQYGPALDLVANDCNSSANPHPIEECRRFDLIVADYYVNGPRAVRVDFSPTWLRTTMSSVKMIKDSNDKAALLNDFTTLTQLQEAGGTACVPEGTYLRTVVMGKFPRANYNDCPGPDECVRRVKEGVCSLYVDDELALRYRALGDRSLEVTGEQFNTQFMVWAISYSLDRQISTLLKKWMYVSVSNATLDELAYKYFTVKLCPLGLAGTNCDQNCDPKHGVGDRDGKCTCHSAKWTGDDCSIEVEEDLNLLPDWEVYLSYTFFGINVLACLVGFAWIHVKRATEQVKVWQPLFLKLILLGCLISSSSIIPATQQSAGDGPVHGCAVFPWLFSIGFSVTFGTLFCKIQRVYRIFKASVRARHVAIPTKETLQYICAITSVDVIICTVWTATDTLHWTRVVTQTDKFGEPLSSVGYCTSNHWKAFVSTMAVWHLLLLGSACIICYLTRHISSEFAESKYLVTAVISNLQIFAISVPVLILVGADPSTSLFVRSAVIWLNDFAIVVIIFGSLYYIVQTGTGNVNVGHAMEQFRLSTNPRSVDEPKISQGRSRQSAMEEFSFNQSEENEK